MRGKHFVGREFEDLCFRGVEGWIAHREVKANEVNQKARSAEVRWLRENEESKEGREEDERRVWIEMERQEDRIFLRSLDELDLFRSPVSRDIGSSVMVRVGVDL